MGRGRARKEKRGASQVVHLEKGETEEVMVIPVILNSPGEQ